VYPDAERKGAKTFLVRRGEEVLECSARRHGQFGASLLRDPARHGEGGFTLGQLYLGVFTR
jgi:hypothetical protein